MAEDALENRWSWRGKVTLQPNGEIRVIFGTKNLKNSGLLLIKRDGNRAYWILDRIVNGLNIEPNFVGKSSTFLGPQGEIGIQKNGERVRILWNGVIVAEAKMPLPGNGFGTSVHGEAKLESESPQPTEPVVFRDDFMRAEGPEDKEIPGEWQVAGLWKTSGTLGPKSDAALNPNPFVFRAQGTAPSVARAGKWWWSDYSVSASVRATQNTANAPLIAGLEAFAPVNGVGLRGEVDFKKGLAFLKIGDKVLATSLPFDAEPSQWHRLRLEPGPGEAKLFVDGILRVEALARLAQGRVALRAATGADSFVDFDDVRVGALTSGHEWGEGALPERFQKDRLMSNWASAASAWKRDDKGVWWNTGDFFGPVTLDLPLPKLAAGEGLQILLGADPKDLRVGSKVSISRPTTSPELTYSLLDSSNRSGKIALPADGSAIKISRRRSLVGDELSLRIGSAVPIAITGRLNDPFAAGIKLGIRPLLNGTPLPPPTLQKLSFSSVTMERLNRAVIGVNITPVSPEIARRIGLADASGAIVDNVDADSPAKTAGVMEGDVICGVDGAKVTDVDSMRAAVGAVKPGAVVKLDILRPRKEASGLDWASCVASTPNVLDYSFTAAPVDWRSARGQWEVAERWTCSPQWSFFAGQDDASPLLWSRFATKGDWTLEAYLATPMDLVRGERSPSDLNITVGANGRDLGSGYSFLFGGKNRSADQIWRGDTIALDKPFEMPPGNGDTHQDWFYIRLEKRTTPQGLRFRYSVNGREIANYLDTRPMPDGGHIGFWTKNGGLSIARVRLWNTALQSGAALASKPIPNFVNPKAGNGLGMWTTRGQGTSASAKLVLTSQTTTKPAKPVLQVTNMQSGGDWTTYVTRKPFAASQHPVWEWDYRVPSGVKVNLYALIDDSWREIAFTGNATSNDSADMGQLGTVTGVMADGKWHHAKFDVNLVLHTKGVQSDTVQAVAFAAPDQSYLRAGLGGNHLGATYWLRDFKTSAEDEMAQ